MQAGLIGLDPLNRTPRLMSFLVMGVCGSGKTTVGRRLAQALERPFIDADDYHPAANVAKMSGGAALDDSDRWPWLDAIAAAAGAHRCRGEDVVIACSALKRAYRRRLVAGAGPLFIVYLAGDRSLLAPRMEARSGHFMPAGLLASQFETLEPPLADEPGITLDAGMPPDLLVARICAVLSQSATKEPADEA